MTDLLPGPTACAAEPKGVRMGDAPRPDRASLRWGSGADSASTSSSLVPAFLTVASVNRYMGDCAARAAGVRNSRPARAKMVWKWAELSEISGMVERAAGDVSANLRSLRDATYAESRVHDVADVGSGVSPGQGLAKTRKQEQTLGKNAADRPHTSTIGSVLREAKAQVQGATAERTMRSLAHSHLRAPARNTASGGRSEAGVADRREELLVSACAALLSADFEGLRHTGIAKETLNRSKCIPKPHSLCVTDTHNGSLRPDRAFATRSPSGMQRPQRSVSSRGNSVPWQNADDGTVMTLNVPGLPATLSASMDNPTTTDAPRDSGLNSASAPDMVEGGDSITKATISPSTRSVQKNLSGDRIRRGSNISPPRDGLRMDPGIRPHEAGRSPQNAMLADTTDLQQIVGPEVSAVTSPGGSHTNNATRGSVQVLPEIVVRRRVSKPQTISQDLKSTLSNSGAGIITKYDMRGTVPPLLREYDQFFRESAGLVERLDQRSISSEQQHGDEAFPPDEQISRNEQDEASLHQNSEDLLERETEVCHEKDLGGLRKSRETLEAPNAFFEQIWRRESQRLETDLALVGSTKICHGFQESRDARCLKIRATHGKRSWSRNGQRNKTPSEWIKDQGYDFKTRFVLSPAAKQVGKDEQSPVTFVLVSTKDARVRTASSHGSHTDTPGHGDQECSVHETHIWRAPSTDNYLNPLNGNDGRDTAPQRRVSVPITPWTQGDDRTESHSIMLENHAVSGSLHQGDMGSMAGIKVSGERVHMAAKNWQKTHTHKDSDGLCSWGASPDKVSSPVAGKKFFTTADADEVAGAKSK